MSSTLSVFPLQVRGVSYTEQTSHGLLLHRLPQEVQHQLPDDFVRMCDQQPAGARLVLRTDADLVHLEVLVLRGTVSPHPVGPGQFFQLYADGVLAASARPAGCGITYLDPIASTTRVELGPAERITFHLAPATGPRTLEIYLPYGEVVYLRAVELERKDGGVVVEENPANHGARTLAWTHYGSSISHGASADDPADTWVSVAARAADADVWNLGMSGQAVADPFAARAIASRPADVISLKIGINIVNGDYLHQRVFGPIVHGFLDTVRAAQPDTPILLVSPIYCPLVEQASGPTMIDPESPPGTVVFKTLGSVERAAEGRLSLQMIRATLAEIVTQRRELGDQNLHYWDGLELYGPSHWDLDPMPDLMHPSPQAHLQMGERFAAQLVRLAAGR